MLSRPCAGPFLLLESGKGPIANIDVTSTVFTYTAQRTGQPHSAFSRRSGGVKATAGSLIQFHIWQWGC